MLCHAILDAFLQALAMVMRAYIIDGRIESPTEFLAAVIIIFMRVLAAKDSRKWGKKYKKFWQ